MKAIKEAWLEASVNGALVYLAEVMQVEQHYVIEINRPPLARTGTNIKGTGEFRLNTLAGNLPDDLCTIRITPYNCDHKPFSFEGKFRPEGIYGLTEIDFYSSPEGAIKWLT